MLADWQEKYLQNVQEISRIRQFFSNERPDFDTWYVQHVEREERLRVLKEECTALLYDHLFPLLDTLHSADEDTIAGLEAFGDRLMDWKNNLDCGVYTAIHDAFLSLCRLRKDRDGVIRELYKLGMGLFYLDRPVMAVYCRDADSIHFHNEMVFTEAASYFRYFDRIEKEETKGFIIRAMANISICAVSYKRRIEASSKTIRTVSSPEYRAMAPGLPWDIFLRRAHQQLSSLRERLSDPEITQTEVAAVMDSCYEVFKPESGSTAPTIRWLWPYYEMEYQCGYVSLEVTAERLEKLILNTDGGKYDSDSIYANVQLPIHLARLIRDHDHLRSDKKHLAFLDSAYRKMLDILMTIPPEMCDDYFNYALNVVVSDFYEIEGSVSYRELIVRLLQRFAGRLYLRSLKTADLMGCLSAHILEKDTDYFSQVPVPEDYSPSEDRKAAILAFAADCGFYCDFGQMKMNMERLTQIRPLFENEAIMFRLHTVSGYRDLQMRKSTECFADTARGHHSSYSGRGDDPSGYIRMESPYRQITDLAAVISDLLDREDADIRIWAKDVRTSGKNRFSPKVLAYLSDENLLSAMEQILADDRSRCLKAYK